MCSRGVLQWLQQCRKGRAVLLLRTLSAAMRTSPWMGLTRPAALESFSSRFWRTAAAAVSSRSFASILLTPSTCSHLSLCPHIT